MPRPAAGLPVEIRIEKPRLLRPYDSTVGKAVAEAAEQELTALFQSGMYRRAFRVVRGAPAPGGLQISSAIHELALGAACENAAMLTFVVVLQADGRRRGVVTGRLEGSASLNVAANPVPQAIRIMRNCVSHQAERFADECAREVTEGR